jgi:hypothetical protein
MDVRGVKDSKKFLTLEFDWAGIVLREETGVINGRVSYELPCPRARCRENLI